MNAVYVKTTKKVSKIKSTLSKVVYRFFIYHFVNIQ